MNPETVSISQLTKTLLKRTDVRVVIDGPVCKRVFVVDTLARSGKSSVNPKDQYTVYCVDGGAGSNCEDISEVKMFLRCFSK